MDRYVAIDNVCAWPNLTLMPDDQRLIDAFLEGFPPSVRKRRTTVMNQLDTIENARAIIKAAMDIALFGGAKRVHGIKVIEGTEVRGLTQLLPGVFHMPHLKVRSISNSTQCCQLN